MAARCRACQSAEHCWCTTATAQRLGPGTSADRMMCCASPSLSGNRGVLVPSGATRCSGVALGPTLHLRRRCERYAFSRLWKPT
jgi:hypothetical protein